MDENPKSAQTMLYEMSLLHQQNKKWNTANLYLSVCKKINLFTGGESIPLNDIDRGWLKSFEVFMRSSGNSWNTISTYMRILHAAINEAVMNNQATFKPYLFNKVYTGVVADRENALEVREMVKLIKLSLDKNSPLKPIHQQTLQYFVLMFMLRGMPFVDLIQLKKKECKRQTIFYRRKKTGRALVVELEEPALKLMKILVNRDESSPYLFPFLHFPEGTKEAHQEYKSAQRNFNNRLKAIAKKLGIKHELTTYTARHTWVTIAFICNINSAVISQSVGHSSVKVTEAYLKPFQQKAINKANKTVLQHVLK